MTSIKWDKYLNVKRTMSKNQGKEQNKIKIQGFVDWQELLTYVFFMIFYLCYDYNNKILYNIIKQMGQLLTIFVKIFANLKHSIGSRKHFVSRSYKS